MSFTCALENPGIFHIVYIFKFGYILFFAICSKYFLQTLELQILELHCILEFSYFKINLY